MIDVNKANARASAQALWHLMIDGGLHWHTTGKRLCPHPMKRVGFLLLRRWKGAKYPRPRIPQAVGYAQRSLKAVTEKGVTVANGVYWYETWVVSGGGLCTRSPADKTRVAVFASGAHVGLLPNAPLKVRAVPAPSSYVIVSWVYNPISQPAAPGSFEIYGDGGTGTMDWVTPVATVDYVPGKMFYRKRLGPYADGDRLFQVRSKTAGGVKSLLPEPSLGQSGYAPAAWSNHNTQGVTVDSDTPSPPPPTFP